MAENRNADFLMFIGDSKCSQPGRSAIAECNAGGWESKGTHKGRGPTLGNKKRNQFFIKEE